MQSLYEATFEKSSAITSPTPIVSTLRNYDSISTYSADNSSVVDSEYIGREVKKYEKERQLVNSTEAPGNQINFQISVLSGNYEISLFTTSLISCQFTYLTLL